MTSGPLDRIRVLELSSGLGSRSAGALLAGLGAEVLSVAEPEETYGPEDPVRVWADRHKTVTGLTLGTVKDTAALRRLADEVDVLVADGVPGHLERYGLDPVTVRDRNPGAVHLWMPGLGVRGRWSHLKGNPLLLAAASGYAGNHPSWAGRPVAPVVPTFGYLHGAMGAAAAIAGLVGRQRSGDGSSVVVSGLHAMAAVLATLMIEAIEGDPVISPRRTPRGGPFYRMYRASDGHWLYLAALSPAIFFRALDVIGRMDVMAREDVAGDFSRLVLPDVTDAVNDELEATFASRTSDEWIHLLRAGDVPVAPVWSRSQWKRSEVAGEVAPHVVFDHPEVGPVRLPCFPIQISPGPPAVDADSLPIRSENGVPTPRPLAGIRVLDASTFLAAPYCGALLADYGAEVVKVEPVDGDPYRVFPLSYTAANQYKRSLGLNLRDRGAREAFLRLLSQSHVLIENIGEQNLDRLGLPDEVLSGARPDLVHCSVSAFGHGNSWSSTPGFDPVLQSMTGLAVAQGGAESPVASNAPVVDISTGALAAVGTLSALFAVGQDGTGRHVRTSLAAAGVFVQSAEMTEYAGRLEPPVGGPDFLGSDPARRFYATQDGWLAIAANSDEERRRFCAAIGDNDPEAVIAVGTLIDWIDRLAAAGVPAAPAMSGTAALHDADLLANGFSHTVPVEGLGRFRIVRGYSDWSGADGLVAESGPVGRDSVPVLAEVGLEPAEIADLLSRGVVAVPEG
jgi:crotonobetainyl-CoA:carnitine CoA-transferase CaiB-like acyl-CoA transferase